MASQGYDPFSPQLPSQGGLWITDTGGGISINPVSTNDYNANAYALWKFGLSGQFADGTPYFSKIEDLRNWIIAREANRKIEDLANVNITRPIKNGDTLQYNADTDLWELTDFISGGTW